MLFPSSVRSDIWLCADAAPDGAHNVGLTTNYKHRAPPERVTVDLTIVFHQWLISFAPLARKRLLFRPNDIPFFHFFIPQLGNGNPANEHNLDVLIRIVLTK
jgi:hypothetical protein